MYSWEEQSEELVVKMIGLVQGKIFCETEQETKTVKLSLKESFNDLIARTFFLF